MITKIVKMFTSHLAFLIWFGFALICILFIIFGTTSENGSITLDGKPAKISDYTEKFIEESNEALYRLMEVDAPTNEDTIKENENTIIITADYANLCGFSSSPKF